jgi:hypothetical protein
VTDALFEELERIDGVPDDPTIAPFIADLVRNELDVAEQRREMAGVCDDSELQQSLNHIRERRARLQEKLRYRRYDEAQLTLRRLLKARGVEIDINAPEARPLLRKATRGLLDVTDEDERREQGIYSQTLPAEPAASEGSATWLQGGILASGQQAVASTTKSDEINVNPSSATTFALKGTESAPRAREDIEPGPTASRSTSATPRKGEKKSGIPFGNAWKQHIAEATSNDMRRHRESSARLFKSILGEETPLAEITPKMVKDARDILARLPKNHGKSARENRAPQEAADAADDHERDKMQALDEQYEFGNIDRKTWTPPITGF